jgi:hypothetical protein
MKAVLLRVGIDTGSGGLHGPLFHDGTFEYIPIPDGFGLDSRTYGNITGRHGMNLIGFFPKSRREKMMNQSIHFDPEFETFTYGDPTSLKAGLRRLDPDDMLIFYCGLEGWDFISPPALYLLGYFDVLAAGKATDFSESTLHDLFRENFHFKHKSIFKKQKDDLVLVKGSGKSQLFEKAVCISTTGRDRRGSPLKVLSAEMQTIFGDFDGKISLQRSSPRWIYPEYTEKAADYIRSL